MKTRGQDLSLGVLQVRGAWWTSGVQCFLASEMPGVDGWVADRSWMYGIGAWRTAFGLADYPLHSVLP